MSSIARPPTSPGVSPRWSPAPAAVIAGAAWVLFGAGAYLVVSQPLVVLGVAVTALLATSAVGRLGQHGDGRGRPTSRTVDLVARLDREAGRR